MLSPHTRGPEVRSGTLVVSETGSAVGSCKQDLRVKKTRTNPFKVPDNSEMFQLMIKEKETRKKEMREYLALPVHEKMNFAGRVQRQLRREMADILGEEEEEQEERRKSLLQRRGKKDQHKILEGRSNLKLAMMRRHNIEKESMHDFIAKRRELLLLEYSLMVKQSEIQKLNEATAEEEKKLKQAEQMLEDDALLFEEFLKENDRSSVEATKIAEQETKSKLEKMAEIKRLNTELMSTKSEISRNEEILKEYKKYKDFLFKLSPPEWQEAQRAKTQRAKDDKKNKEGKKVEAEKKSGVRHGLESKVSSAGGALSPIRSSKLSSRQSNKPSAHRDKPIQVSKPDSDSSEYEDEAELYFSDPQQLLDLLTELEEQNLTLIRNSTETEESLEELQQTMETNRKKMEQDAQQLASQINILNQSITREKEMAAELELKVHLFNYGNFKTDEDRMLDALSIKVEDVYRCCLNDNKAGLSTLQMLANIEKRLSVLLDSMETIPAETLEKVEKMKDRERRIRQREEKQRQKKEHQEERLKKSLARSQAEVKKRTGRKLMSRSKPIAQKVKLDTVNTTSEQDEFHAFLYG